MLVRKTMCKTCIYRPESPLDLERLENECKDRFGFYAGYRICHAHQDASNVCCRGFYNAHGDESTPLQIAGRLGLVRFTDTGE